MKQVAVLATGDELINGDILNTNTQLIAQFLRDNNINLGLQMIAPDNQHVIADAINYLLQRHAALIITGGLGPTSDDCTRFALSQATSAPLEFNEASWQRIIDRFTKLKINIPDNNKQQALFPQNATVLINSKGSADACMLIHQGKMIFMLPGPPQECLTLFRQQVLPKLIEADFSHKSIRKSWLLLGVSESDIAHKIDQQIGEQDITVGYRVSYPYLEIKLESPSLDNIKAVIKKIKPYISSYIISEHKLTASEQLQHSLSKYSGRLVIEDDATGGLLESTLKTPATFNHVLFNHAVHFDESMNTTTVRIQGLEAFWDEDPTSTNTSIAICIKSTSDMHVINKQIPYRGKRTQLLAVEMICWELYKHLTQPRQQVLETN